MGRCEGSWAESSLPTWGQVSRAQVQVRPGSGLLSACLGRALSEDSTWLGIGKGRWGWGSFHEAGQPVNLQGLLREESEQQEQASQEALELSLRLRVKFNVACGSAESRGSLLAAGMVNVRSESAGAWASTWGQ